jgi:hypothetical protein
MPNAANGAWFKAKFKIRLGIRTPPRGWREHMALPPKAPDGREADAREWDDDDYDVLADGVVVGRILKVNAAPASRAP